MAEWLLHDEFSLISQLGFTDLTSIPHPPLDNKLHDCTVSEPGFGWRFPGEDPPVVSEHGFLDNVSRFLIELITNINKPVQRG